MARICSIIVVLICALFSANLALAATTSGAAPLAIGETFTIVSGG